MNWKTYLPWLTFILLFGLSFWIRFNDLNNFSPLDLIPTANRELGAIAISLAQSGEFADPYYLRSGPTAHLPPLYPWLVSLIYRGYGLTAAAGYASKMLIVVAGSLLIALLPWLSGQLGLGWQPGLIGGLAGAFVWDWHGHGEYLTGLVLGLLLVAFVQRWTRQRTSWHGSLFLGLAIGASFHLQPALLLVMLGCMAFEAIWLRTRKKWLYLAVMALGIGLACLPWAWRNYTTFKAVFFIRSNFGLELRMGNHDGAAATMDEMDAQQVSRATVHRHPTIDIKEAQLLLELGEIEYMRLAKQEALDWIASHPLDFLKLTVQRIANVWLGPQPSNLANAGVLILTLLVLLGVWRVVPKLAIPQRAAIFIPLATYPVVYYIVAYMPRYRVPVDWILYLLAGAAVWSLVQRKAFPPELDEADFGTEPAGHA